MCYLFPLLCCQSNCNDKQHIKIRYQLVCPHNRNLIIFFFPPLAYKNWELMSILSLTARMAVQIDFEEYVGSIT